MNYSSNKNIGGNKFTNIGGISSLLTNYFYNLKSLRRQDN